MRLIRLVFVVISLAVVVVLFTLPAWAHVTVLSATTVPGDTDQVIRFDAPIERDANNADLLVAMDPAWRPVSCQAPAGWTCSAATEAGRPAFRFTTTTPNDATTFVLTAHSPSAAGTWAFPSIQSYDDGHVSRWIGPAGSEEPAPTITTTAAAVTTVPPTTPPTVAPVVTTARPTTPTTRGASTPTTVAPAATTTGVSVESSTTSSTVAKSTSTTSTTIAEVAVKDDDSGGTSALPFVVGGIVVVGAGAGGVAYYLRKRRGTPPAPTGE
jgi:hypothetical protein